MSGMKKPAMAVAAEQLLAGTGWLPALLRTFEADRSESAGTAEDETFAEAAE
jgi:ParB family chromosome partitioning protein